MGIKRHRPEEIVTKLRQVEVLVGQGLARIDAIRDVQITEQTFYRWRKQYGGMGTAQLKELKRLQKENEQLTRAVSDLTLHKLILTEATSNILNQMGQILLKIRPLIVSIYMTTNKYQTWQKSKSQTPSSNSTATK